jgi:hypothetical protein
MPLAKSGSSNAAASTDPHAICPQELQVRTASYRGGGECDNQVIRIPLTGCPGEGLPFRQCDIQLDNGDVVYVPRREEYFYVGGMVAGARKSLCHATRTST